MEYLLDVMKLFVSDDEMRTLMHQPFRTGENQFATDAHSLIKVPLSVMDLGLVEQENPKCDAVIPADNCEISVTLSDIFNGIEIKMIDEMKTVIDTCDACNGSGEVEWEFRHNHQSYELDENCPVCDGEGKSETEVPSGNTIPNPEQIVSLNGITYIKFQLERMKKAFEMLGIDTVTQTHKSSTIGNKFIANDILILVMPCTPPNF